MFWVGVDFLSDLWYNVIIKTKGRFKTMLNIEDIKPNTYKYAGKIDDGLALYDVIIKESDLISLKYEILQLRQVAQMFIDLWPVCAETGKPKATPEVIAVWQAAKNILR